MKKPDRKIINLIMVIGLAGILLIMLSQCTTQKPVQEQTGGYVDELEKRLLKIIEQVDGVGSVSIMITLENGVENIYASNREIQKQLEPTIKGVVVVCDGADNIYTQEKIMDVVMTALNIKSTRVCVVKLGEANV